MGNTHQKKLSDLQNLRSRLDNLVKQPLPPLRILVTGTQLSGKSCFMNSSFAVFSRKWADICRTSVPERNQDLTKTTMLTFFYLINKRIPWVLMEAVGLDRDEFTDKNASVNVQFWKTVLGGAKQFCSKELVLEELDNRPDIVFILLDDSSFVIYDRCLEYFSNNLIDKSEEGPEYYVVISKVDKLSEDETTQCKTRAQSIFDTGKVYFVENFRFPDHIYRTDPQSSADIQREMRLLQFWIDVLTNFFERRSRKK